MSLCCCRQIVPWVCPLAVDAHLEVKVWAGGAAGAAGQGDDIAGLHSLAHPHQQLGVVGVEGGQAIAVVHHHVVAIAAVVLGGGDRTGQGGPDGGAGGNRQIHAGVSPGLPAPMGEQKPSAPM